MSVQVAAVRGKARPPGVAAWPYAEHMARWERQVERRQLFLRSYHFSRDADDAPRRRVVWAGLRRAAARGLRRLRARLRLCFGSRYGRLSGAGKRAACLC